MPESLSLLRKTTKTSVIKEWLGAQVPWETKSYFEDTLAIETVGGVFDLTSWAAICLTGKDTFDYLHRMTTVDFKTLPNKTATFGAFLTGKGTVVSLGTFIKQENLVMYVTSGLQRQKALDHIEKFHFAEDFVSEDASGEVALLGWWSPRKDILDELHLDPTIPAGQVEWRRWKSLDLEIWRDPVRVKLFYFIAKRKEAENFLFELERMAVPLVGHRVFENLRIRAGVPEVGVDLTDKEIILESGFDIAVSRNKGCYPGQEVVERIFTYGSVNKKLHPVIVSSKNLEKISLPYELSEKGSKMGQLVSLSIDPRDGSKGWGLAYLQKEFWNRNTVFELKS